MDDDGAIATASTFPVARGYNYGSVVVLRSGRMGWHLTLTGASPMLLLSVCPSGLSLSLVCLSLPPLSPPVSNSLCPCPCSLARSPHALCPLYPSPPASKRPPARCAAPDRRPQTPVQSRVPVVSAGQSPAAKSLLARRPLSPPHGNFFGLSGFCVCFPSPHEPLILAPTLSTIDPRFVSVSVSASLQALSRAPRSDHPRPLFSVLCLSQRYFSPPRENVAICVLGSSAVVNDPLSWPGPDWTGPFIEATSPCDALL